MPPKPKPRVLCVDDEPAVLEGLALSLRKPFEVLSAESGAAGLQLLAADPGVAVVISDMRMPGMDGATFLGRCRSAAPDATRLLLTGQADLPSAIAAINDGRIFRFLTKPCTPELLLEAVGSAAEQHRLVTAERVLLEQTLQACIRALCDVLAQVHPQAFGRALRVKRLAADLATAAHLEGRWQLEVAAMLSQLSAVTLPPDTLAAWEAGSILTKSEQAMVDRMPQFTEELLERIPRIEGVRAILAQQQHPPRKMGEVPFEIGRAAQALRIATAYDRARSDGLAAEHALARLRSQAGEYDADLLANFAELHDLDTGDTIKQVYIRGLRAGMVLVEDLRTTTGVLLGARGYQLTESFIGRLLNFRPGMVREPIAAAVRSEAGAS